MTVAAYVDVDFENQPQYIPGYTREQLNTFNASKGEYKKYGDNFDTIPEGDWKELANNLQKAGGNCQRVARVMNQSNEGSCVGNMAAAACEYLQSRAVGRDKVISISAMSMYKQIGSSPNSGANVGDSMKRAIDTGFLPLDTDENKRRFKHTMSHTGFRQSWPSGWKDTAELFANCEAFVCESYAEAFSAGLKGMCIGVGRAGHSILYLDPIWDDSAWFWDYVNSWGQWGFGKGQFEYGFGRDSSRYWKSALDWCVAWEAADTAGFEWILAQAA